MSKFATLLENPNSFDILLAVAESEDLGVLIDYITDNGKGRLALDKESLKKLVAARSKLVIGKEERMLIAREILLFGGNSIVNAYRGVLKETSIGRIVGNVLPSISRTPDYETVLRDVAKQVSASCDEKDQSMEIESGILLKIFKKALGKMSEDERAKVLDELGIPNISLLTDGTLLGASAFLTAQAAAASLSVATIVASAVSSQMLGRTLAVVPAYLGVRPLAALAGPIGWAVGALWTIAGLSSPAYRVTVPCVVQLAFMRQKYIFEANVLNCEKCSFPNTITAKFCNSCGGVLR